MSNNTTNGLGDQHLRATAADVVRQDLQRIFHVLCILTAAFELAMEMDDDRREG